MWSYHISLAYPEQDLAMANLRLQSSSVLFEILGEKIELKINEGTKSTRKSEVDVSSLSAIRWYSVLINQSGDEFTGMRNYCSL